jgi:hypothetical protein
MVLLTMATSASLDCSLLEAGFSDNPLDGVHVFSFPKVEKRRYVGVPGMNSICKALSLSEGVQANYGVTVTGLEWRKDGLWNVKAKDGESLGVFDAVIIADKGLASARFLAQTGLPPPLGILSYICSLPRNMYILGEWVLFMVLVDVLAPFYF